MLPINQKDYGNINTIIVVFILSPYKPLLEAITT